LQHQLTEKERTQMEKNIDEWAKELEEELAALAPDMRAAQTRLEQKGFRVDSGNKTSTTGWWLTANNRNMSHGSIKVQSDGTKIVVTVES